MEKAKIGSNEALSFFLNSISDFKILFVWLSNALYRISLSTLKTKKKTLITTTKNCNYVRQLEQQQPVAAGTTTTIQTKTATRTTTTATKSIETATKPIVTATGTTSTKQQVL